MATLLELRRLHFDLVMVYKILHNYVDIDFSDFFTLWVNTSARRHDKLLYPSLSKLNCRFHFFSNRIINLWNTLPALVVESKSVVIFKRHLSTVNLSDFLKCTV